MMTVSFCLAHDVSLYRELVSRMPGTLPPPFSLLLYTGSDTCGLLDRRAADAMVWRGFRAIIAQRFPDVSAWTTTRAANGTRFASVPERIVYEAVAPCLGRGIILELYARLPIAGGRFCSDFHLIVQSGRTLHVKVAGGFGRDQGPERAREHRRAGSLADKLTAHKAARLPMPAIVHADGVCDVEGLDQPVEGILRGIREPVL